MKLKFLGLTLLLVSSLAACATIKKALPIEDVKPWERNILAQDKMQLDSHLMEAITDDKTYFSREASRGGGGLGGGGCGCN